MSEEKKRRWLVKWVKRQGPGFYYARVTSFECLTPGAAWEERAFFFQAPERKGPSVVRAVASESATANMTSTEFFNRVCAIGKEAR